MERRIERHYGLNGEQLRQAILEFLRRRDIPCPLKASDAHWEIDGNGARFQWTEEGEFALPTMPS